MSDDLIRRSSALKVLHLYGWTPIDGLYDIFAHDIPSADRQQRWIPCSEGLPEEDGEYLVTQKNGSIGIYVFNSDGNSEEYFKRCATAWMPLPKPWKGADDE